eukprot:gene11727-biopygen15438
MGNPGPESCAQASTAPSRDAGVCGRAQRVTFRGGGGRSHSAGDFGSSTGSERGCRMEMSTKDAKCQECQQNEKCMSCHMNTASERCRGYLGELCTDVDPPQPLPLSPPLIFTDGERETKLVKGALVRDRHGVASGRLEKCFWQIGVISMIFMYGM